MVSGRGVLRSDEEAQLSVKDGPGKIPSAPVDGYKPFHPFLNSLRVLSKCAVSPDYSLSCVIKV